MPGRKPVPTALKILRGNPGRRPLPAWEPKVRGKLKDPPPWFNEEQSTEWREVLRNAPKGVLHRIDGTILAAWVVASCLHRAASEAVARDGMVILAPNTMLPIQSPYLAIVNRQAVILARLACELGFTPASRPKIHVEPTGGADPLEKLLARGAAGRRNSGKRPAEETEEPS